MNDSTRKIYLVTLVFCAIVCTGFVAIIFNFMRSFTAPPSYASAWMIVIMVIIFTCILVTFTSALYVLILMLGFAELRAQLHDFRIKREQTQPKMSSLPARVSLGAMPIRRRQPSRYTLHDE